jgi:hypothetical protein
LLVARGHYAAAPAPDGAGAVGTAPSCAGLAGVDLLVAGGRCLLLLSVLRMRMVSAETCSLPGV